jgi:hypothetical protein
MFNRLLLIVTIRSPYSYAVEPSAVEKKLNHIYVDLAGGKSEAKRGT